MIIVSAGMYRSGSTWLYNAIRLLSGDCYSTFVHSGNDYDKENPKDIHLLKVHKYSNWMSNQADLVITIYRDIREVKESMERRKLVATEGFTNEARTDLFDIYHHNSMLWYMEADLIVNYETMLENPVFVLGQIHRAMYSAGVPFKEKSIEEMEQISEELRNMKVPETGSDPVTLLHQEHITKKTW
jgi:hypothetical protein